MRNNDVIRAKVTEVDVSTIKYLKFDNQDGPVYTLLKSDIYMIIYANGTRDLMTDQAPSDSLQQNTANQQYGGQQNNTAQPDNSNQQNYSNQQTNTGQQNYSAQPSNSSQQDNSYQQNNQNQQTNSGQQNYSSQPNNSNQKYNSGQQNYSNQQDNSYQQGYQNQQNNGYQQDNSGQQYYSSQQQGGPVTMQTFYDQLSPYGNWVNSPSYGYVWVPSVGMDFTPYATAGHWVFTDYGWTWVSDFPWGWAAFHYGRWYYDSYLGYVWTPNTVWGPAWVTWRSSPGYYGWAPMGPAGYVYPQQNWTFVSAGYVTSPQVSNYYESRQSVTVIYNNTTVVQNNNAGTAQANYSSGPSRTEVEQVTHSTITPVKIVSSNTPGQTVHTNGQLTMYHPAVQAENSAAPSKPEHVQSVNNIKPPALRTTVVHPAVAPVHSSQPEHTQPGNVNQNTAPAQHYTPTQPEQHQTQTAEPQQPAKSEPAQQQQPKPAQQAKPAQKQAQKPAPAPKPAPRPKSEEHH